MTGCKFFSDESGQTAIEYLFLVAGSLLTVLLIALLVQNLVVKNSSGAVANRP